MTPSQFSALISDPGNIASADEQALKNITDKHPYFSAAHILLSKYFYLKNKKEIFQNQVKIAAAHTGDRKRLYEFIYDKETVADQPEQQKTEPPPSLPEEPPVQKTTPPAEPPPEQKKDTIKEDAESTAAPHAPEVKEKQVVKEKKRPSLAVKKALPKPPVKKPEPPAEITAEAAPAPEEIKKAEPIEKDAKHSFSEWLALINKEKGHEKSRPEKEKAKTTSQNEVLKIKQDEDDLKAIRSFVQAQKAAAPEKRKKTPEQDIDDFVTETFAQILVLQQRYQKAIDVYEKLSFKYPEKKNIFASKIEELKSKF